MTEILKFGLIADLQYAESDDGYNFDKTKRRYYRNGSYLLSDAMQDWKRHNIEFILQLGDIIDGSCRKTGKSLICFDHIMDIFGKESWPILSLVGNHDLYNFQKETLYMSRLFSALSPNNKGYYTTEPHPGIKICALNTYEISIVGSNMETPEYEEANIFLRENPNDDKNSPEGLPGIKRRFCHFNGAVSSGQLEWITEELSSAEKKKQNVIVIGHNPIFQDAADGSCLCWNCDVVQNTLSEYKSCVVCYISGHDHDGGYAVDQNGIHHITMLGAIEHPDTYAIGTLYQDCIQIEGKGDMFNVTCPLKYPL